MQGPDVGDDTVWSNPYYVVGERNKHISRGGGVLY